MDATVLNAALQCHASLDSSLNVICCGISCNITATTQLMVLAPERKTRRYREQVLLILNSCWPSGAAYTIVIPFAAFLNVPVQMLCRSSGLPRGVAEVYVEYAYCCSVKLPDRSFAIVIRCSNLFNHHLQRSRSNLNKLKDLS